MKEKQPGLIEKVSFVSRNVEAVVAGIALFLGHYGVAALSAIGAVIDHKIGKHFEKKRLTAS